MSVYTRGFHRKTSDFVPKLREKSIQTLATNPGLMRCCSSTASASSLLAHGWDRIKHLNCYSLLALSTHKNVKSYPTMTKAKRVSADLLEPWDVRLRSPGLRVSGFRLKVSVWLLWGLGFRV